MYNWKISGVSLAGNKHLKVGKETQDKIYSKKVNGAVGISLADGAGSYEKSEIGAETVTEGSIDYVIKNFDKLFKMNENEISKNIVNYLHKKLNKKALELNVEKKELSSTLLFAVLKANKGIIGHIGDGVIGKISKNILNVISYPDNGEYINSTFFVTAEKAEQNFRIQKIQNFDNIQGIFIMSDGTAESFYNRKEKKLAKAIANIAEWLTEYEEEEVKKALIDNFNKQILTKTEDDCSFNLMVKVTSDNRDIILKDRNELIDIFQTKNSRTLDRMVSVLDEINNGNLSSEIISKKTNILKRAINRYLKKMKERGII